MPTLLRDCRFALRGLRRSPGFALAAIVTLGLSLGANATVFGVINALLLRPLPVDRPGELVRVGESVDGDGFGPISYLDYQDLAARARTVHLVAHHPAGAIVTAAGAPREEWIELVSANYFTELGVGVSLGRTPAAAEVVNPGAASVAVVSDDYWRRHLGADPGVVGRVLKINGQSLTVIGVAEPGWHGTFAGIAINFWLPITMEPLVEPVGGEAGERIGRPPLLADRAGRFLQVIGRRQPGQSPNQVQAELTTLLDQIKLAGSGDGRRVGIALRAATGIHPFIAGLITAFLVLLQAIVGVVLVIACVNLASLLLARAADRTRDLAIRSAVGATRARLAGELLIESLILSIAGGGLGAAIAIGLVRGLAHLDLPIGIPVSFDFHLDWRAFGFTFAASVVAALAFGLGPAWRFSKPDSLGDLRMAAGSGGIGRSRLTKLLIGAQLTFATILLLGAVLLVRSLGRAGSVDPGFDAAGVMTLQASPELLGYDEAKVRAFWKRLASEAAALPGADRVALGLFVPLGSRHDLLPMRRSGNAAGAVDQEYNIVTPGYLSLLRIPLLAGRDFQAGDIGGGPDVIVVTASAGRRFFGSDDPVGRSLDITDRAGRHRTATVIGVTGDIKLANLGSADQPLIYLPFGQWYRQDMVLHVRSRGPIAPLAQPLEALVRRIDPDLPVSVQPMQHETGFALIPLEIASAVLTFAGVTGLLLAVVGVFGVVAYAVAQRQRELGIRIALGADRAQVIRYALFQGLTPALIGLAIGLPLGIAAAAVARSQLIGVGIADPIALLTVPLVLAPATALAAYLPARRTTRVNPLTVLRGD